MVYRPPLAFGLAFVICFAIPGWVWGQPPVPPQPGISATAAAEDETSPLLNEPETPSDVLEAIVLFVDLARPKLAARYLDKLMRAKLDDATLLAMRDEYGPAVFLRLANIPELRPHSVELMQSIDEAIRRRTSDPAHIDRLVEQLGKTPAEHEIAIQELRSGGAISVPRLIQHLQDPSKGPLHAEIVYALGRIGEEAVAPLVAALESPNSDLREDVIEALSLTNLPDVTTYLWYSGFAPNQPAGVQHAARIGLTRLSGKTPEQIGASSPSGIAKMLEQAALMHFRGTAHWNLNDDGSVTYWTWDPAAGTVTSRKVSPEVASLDTGLRFARQGLALAPQNENLQALFVASALTLESQKAGWGQSLPAGPGTAHDLALTAGESLVAQALALALENGRPAAAVAALRVLGQNGTRHLVQSGTKSSPVLAALNYPDNRVQFAAATTILELQPDRPFRNSSRVMSILERALNNGSIPAAVVVDPNEQRGGVIAGLVEQLGYRTEFASTGREGFQIASERGDVELVVLDQNTIRWDLSATIANLRADARTSSIPIVVYGSNTGGKSLQRMELRDPLLIAVSEPDTADGFKRQIDPFLSRVKTPAPSPTEKARQRALAASWLAHLADRQGATSLFDLRTAEESIFNALSEPELATDLVFVLGSIPTGTAQERLLEIVLTQARDGAIREMAARQLAFHIQKHGLLISRQGVMDLRTQYRQSDDPGLKTALASVVGSLDPNPASVSERLQNFAQPALP